MNPHSLDRARRIATGPLVLPDELRQPDRRALDLAVFEFLGVRDPIERPRIVDLLYAEVARHFRSIRVVEIEKQEQRSRTANRRFNILELAADAWDAAELSDATPLAESRTGDPRLQTQIIEQLKGWFVFGRVQAGSPESLVLEKQGESDALLLEQARREDQGRPGVSIEEVMKRFGITPEDAARPDSFD